MKHKDILRALCKEYNFGNASIISRANGVSSLNYFIEADCMQLFLKIFESENLYTVQKIEKIIDFLALHNIPVVKPLATKNGALHFEVSDKIIAVYPRLKADALKLEKLNKESICSAASIIALIHNLAPHCKLPLYSTKDSIKSFDEIAFKAAEVKALIKSSPITKDIDQAVYKLIDLKLGIIAGMAKEDKQFNYYLPCEDLIHGDYHPENILIDKDNNIAAILDFETMHFGHRIEDIVHFIFFSCYAIANKANNLRKAKLFIKCYLARNLLKTDEIVFGVRYLLYKMVSSFFIENKLYLLRDPTIIKSVEWEMSKISYLTRYQHRFIKSLCSGNISIYCNL